jgi:group I intron endonuclease
MDIGRWLRPIDFAFYLKNDQKSLESTEVNFERIQLNIEVLSKGMEFYNQIRIKYVGLSKFKPEENPEYLGSGYILRRAIVCYGEDKFKKEILEELDDKETLLLRERYWIKRLKANHRDVGYNICEGGTWGDNWEHNPRKEELRKHFSEMYSGKDNPNYGNKWNKKQKEHMRQSANERKSWIDKKSGLCWSQLPEIKKKLSSTKMGLLNPQSSIWKLISPNKEEFIIEGGIKRLIRNYGVDYQTFTIIEDNFTRRNRSGWKLIKIPKEQIETLQKEIK